MSYEEKLKFWEVFNSESCPCGKPKASLHWVCRSCRKKLIGTREREEILVACDNHLLAANKMFEFLFGKKLIGV